VDPLWATVAEFWWIGPTAVGTGTLGWFGLRRGRRERTRRIELDAARWQLRTAQRDAATARARVRVARTELARAQAERAAGRTGAVDVAAARRELERASADARAATATTRVRRAHVSAARAALPPAGDEANAPLARLMATHDALTARWMAYETDPARLIAFPAMTDARQPLTAAYLLAEKEARALRPPSGRARIDPQGFTAYRDAIAAAGRALDAAEAEAWRLARAAGDAPRTPRPGDPDAGSRASLPWDEWSTVAQNLAQTAIARGSEALARALSARPAPDARGTRSRPDIRHPSRPADAGADARAARDANDPHDAAGSHVAASPNGARDANDPDDPTTGGARRVPIWPVPGRPRA